MGRREPVHEKNCSATRPGGSEGRPTPGLRPLAERDVRCWVSANERSGAHCRRRKAQRPVAARRQRRGAGRARGTRPLARVDVIGGRRPMSEPEGGGPPPGRAAPRRSFGRAATPPPPPASASQSTTTTRPMEDASRTAEFCCADPAAAAPSR